MDWLGKYDGPGHVFEMDPLSICCWRRGNGKICIVVAYKHLGVHHDIQSPYHLLLQQNLQTNKKNNKQRQKLLVFFKTKR